MSNPFINLSRYEQFTVRLCEEIETQLADEDPNDPLYQSNPQALARELLQHIRSRQ